MSLYVIGVGGTGAKCLESVVQAASVGIISNSPAEPINLLFVDADETNGNLDRAKSSLVLYQKCRSLFPQDSPSLLWLRNRLESLPVWSPFGQVSTNKNLGSFFSYNTMRQNSPALKDLFDVLYTKDERDVELDVGFRGRPAIGSAVMSRIDLDALDEEPWRTLIQGIKAEASAGEKPKVILCGSIFGGTGAAGLPTIGRLLANKLKKELKSQVPPVACIFVLPYFGFSPPPSQDDDVYARADAFLLNTEAALRYYLKQAEQSFNSIYLIGNQRFSNMRFSIGKQTQRNESHFVELFAALAVRHYATNSTPANGSVLLMSRQVPGALTWNDLPDRNVVAPALIGATRFAYLWLSNLAPELLRAKEVGVSRAQREIPWFNRFFRPSTSALGGFFGRKGEELPEFDEREQESIATVNRWCKDYLRWLSEIHDCDGETIRLFDSSCFNALSGKTVMSDQLSQLVIDSGLDKSALTRDSVANLRIQLNNPNQVPLGNGSIGLAQTAFALCSQQIS